MSIRQPQPLQLQWPVERNKTPKWDGARVFVHSNGLLVISLHLLFATIPCCNFQQGTAWTKGKKNRKLSRKKYTWHHPHSYRIPSGIVALFLPCCRAAPAPWLLRRFLLLPIPHPSGPPGVGSGSNNTLDLFKALNVFQGFYLWNTYTVIWRFP